MMTILFLLAQIACGITVSTVMSFDPGPAAANTSTVVASPNAVVADGLSTATLTFTARDAYNNLVSGTAVSLAASGGNNTFGASSGTTNGTGTFTTTLASTNAQSEVVTASFGSSLSVTTTVQFVPGAASSAMSSLVLSPNTQVADNSNVIVASLTLKDTQGNPISNIVPTFTASGNNTTVSTAAATSASGQASATYKTTLAQNENALVTGGGLSFIAPMTFMPGPPAAAASTLAASPNIAAGNGSAAISLVATARDAQGNVVSGASVTLSASGGNNTFAAANGNTATGGIYTTSLTSTVMQTETVTARIAGNFNQTVSVTFTGNANATTSTFAVSPNTQTVGPSNLITATLVLKDAASNPLAGIAPSWSASGGNNTIAASGNTSASGVATATFSSTLAQTETAQVVAGGQTFSQSITFLAGSPNASKSVAYSKPLRQIANNSNSIAVYAVLRDSYNNLVTNQAISFSASGAATTITSNGNTNTGGLSSATYRTGTPQNENAVLTSASMTLTQPLIFTSVPTACTLSVSPSSATANGNATLSLTATVTNANGATTLGDVLVAFSSSGGATAFTPTSAITTSQGTATTSISSFAGGNSNFIAIAGAIKCTTQGNFSYPTAYCSGNPNYTTYSVALPSSAWGLTSADINADGVQDLAVTYGNNSMGVLLGNSNGVFQTSTSYPVTNSNYAGIAAADVNGDGRGDVIVSSLSSYGLNVLFGSSSGTLSVQSPLKTSNPLGLSLWDVDSDGAIDIVTGDRSGSTSTIFLGTGTGQFLPPISYPANNAPNGATGIGDFNNDGLVDLAVPNYGNSTCSVLIGNAPGAFAAPSTLTVTHSNVAMVRVGDLDGDGRQDIAVNNSGNANIYIFFGLGDGTFKPIKSIPTSGSSQSFQIDDMNGDGYPDIIVADVSNNYVSINLGTGSGNFKAPISFAAGSYTSALVTGDFSKDGKKDIATVNANSPYKLTVYVYSGCQ